MNDIGKIPYTAVTSPWRALSQLPTEPPSSSTSGILLKITLMCLLQHYPQQKKKETQIFISG